MSSNTQVHVTARERFSLDTALGPGGNQVLLGVLQKLCARQFPAEICAQLPWQSVAGREKTFRCRVEAHDVVLTLQGSIPKLTVSGIHSTGIIPESAMKQAHAAVNRVLALAVSDRIAAKLSAYAEERISQVAQERVSQTIALKALQLQNSRLAIRASCGILVKS